MSCTKLSDDNCLQKLTVWSGINSDPADYFWIRIRNTGDRFKSENVSSLFTVKLATGRKYGPERILMSKVSGPPNIPPPPPPPHTHTI